MNRNRKFLEFVITVMLVVLIGVGCREVDDGQIQIEPQMPSAQVVENLDSIFSSSNKCLSGFNEDTVLYTVFSHTQLESFDDCQDFSEIDFSEFTLVVGKITVSSISDSISTVTLTLNDNKYKVEVTINKCEECYAAIGSLYFWRLYPKLQTKFDIELVVR